MFDLEQRLRQWRHEIEATLAFSREEIDELEDHLRFSLAAKERTGISAEKAWNDSQVDLGSASALALEFAKDKFLPALWRLLKAWCRPACLIVLFAVIYMGAFSAEPVLKSPGISDDASPYRAPMPWILVAASLVLTLIYLPRKSQRNALLSGLGNAVCLIPLLHAALYNAATERIIGPGWSRMAASFGWLPISLGLIGLLIVNFWWWKRGASMLPVVAMLVLVFAVSPLVGEGIGNLSIREVYSMPTPAVVNYTGETLSDFLKWKFVDVLISSTMDIANFLPFALTLVIAAGVAVVHLCTRRCQHPSKDRIFPARSTLPWAMTLLGSGLSWVVGHVIEPPFSNQMRDATTSVKHFTFSYGGLEIMVLLSAALFFICGWDLTKEIAKASRLRPFYAAMLVAFELGVALGLWLVPVLYEMDPFTPREAPRSAQPEWLSWVLGLGILTMALHQAWLIAHKCRDESTEVSLWRFEGADLVELGLGLGLIFAGAWLIFFMVALVMAFESVSVISAMIAWGSWIKDPVKNHFYPQMYGTPDHLGFWAAASLTYLAFCLAAGLGVVIFLSALEFIRFNCFRLYKVRKIRQELTAIALNN